jgi:hypothetical protein
MPPQAGDVYGDLVEKTLADTFATKASLEARGLAVVSTSGVLITILTAVAKLLPSKGPAPAVADAFLIAAAVLFALAAGAGLAIAFPRKYLTPAPDELLDLIAEWHYDHEEAQVRVAVMRARMVERGRHRNIFKSRTLAWALGAEGPRGRGRRDGGHHQHGVRNAKTPRRRTQARRRRVVRFPPDQGGEGRAAMGEALYRWAENSAVMEGDQEVWTIAWVPIEGGEPIVKRVSAATQTAIAVGGWLDPKRLVTAATIDELTGQGGAA